MNPPRHGRLDDPDDTNQSHCGFFAVAVGGRKHKGPLSRLGERGKESRKLKWVRSGQLQPCRGKGFSGWDCAQATTIQEWTRRIGFEKG